MFTTLKARIQELEDKLKECFDTKKQLELNAIKRGGGKRKRTITKGMRAIKRKVNNIKKECEKVKQKDDAYKGKMNFMDFALKFKNMLKSK
jgi:FtsZ-binding cell division protein ZapB